MKKIAFFFTSQLINEKSLQSLRENRMIFSQSNCELNVFEIYQNSELMSFKSDDLVVICILSGKKAIHLFEDLSFDCLPGEITIIPQNMEVKLYFPEASKENPTQCVILAIDNEIIIDTLDFLNEKYPKKDIFLGELELRRYFSYNNENLSSTMNKLLKECMDNTFTKDVIVDLILQELIIRIIQTQDKKYFGNKLLKNPYNPIASSIEFIRKNIKKKINVKDLSDKACMSMASFYRYFKREMGVSPIEYILNEKIKYAKKLLNNPNIHINEVSYLTGFEDCNYFIRTFKKHEGITPKQYQLMNNIMV